MDDNNKSREELLVELVAARKRIAELKAYVPEYKLTKVTLDRCSEELDKSRRRVRDLEQELAQAMAGGAAAVTAKNEFLARMSHEIRTPLNAVIGLASLALKHELSAKLSDYLNKIRSSANALLGIVNDIMDYSNIEGKKLKLAPVAFHLQDVMNRLVDRFAATASQKGVEFKLSIGADVPTALVGDHIRLGQVLGHFVENGLKFTHQGKVELTATLIETNSRRARIRFCVADTGIGLAPEQVQGLFGLFTQADDSMSRQYGGTGIGLALCKRLVEMMGGTIEVASEQGHGSEFSFALDLDLDSQRRQFAEILPEHLRGRRILIVEDEPLWRRVLSGYLKAFSFATAEAATGAAALVELERTDHSAPYDMILMDWMMPEMDGLEAARRIRSHPSLRHKPPVILISAYSGEAVMQRAEELGVRGFLLKPVTQGLLFDTIVAVFEREAAAPAAEAAMSSAPAARRLDGARILVVEDNAINQQVVGETLESWGVAVTFADNGQEALNIVEAYGPGNFDAVLMDVQMPVLDGLEATRRLRSNPLFAELPIIALTAHARPEDREQCLESGMNDYLTKPLNPGLLFSILGQWIQAHGESAPPLPPAPKIQADALPASLPGIDVNAALEILSGNKKLFVDVLEEICKNYAETTSQIKASLAAGDTETACRQAHTMKGVAGNIAAVRLADEARKLEFAIKEGRSVEYPALLDAFDLALHEVLGAAAIISGALCKPDKAVEDAVPALRILLVDDARINRRVFSDLLAKHGHEVVLAENGQQGYDLLLASALQGSPFDVVLMDIEMPVLDGFKATRLIRAIAEDGGIAVCLTPIIALTSHEVEANKNRYLDAGMDDCVTKSFDGASLMAALDSLYRSRIAVSRHPSPSSSVTPSPAALNPDALAPLVAALARHLRRNNTKAQDDILELKAVLALAAAGEPYQSLVARLEEQLGAFEFQEALAVLERFATLAGIPWEAV